MMLQYITTNTMVFGTPTLRIISSLFWYIVVIIFIVVVLLDHC